MSGSSLSVFTKRFQTPQPVVILAWTCVIAFQILLIGTYSVIRGAQISAFHVYPFIWINLSVWVLWKIDPPTPGRRQQLLAGTIGTIYFAVLGFFSGLYGIVGLYGHPEEHMQYFYEMQGLELLLFVPPGHGPALQYISPTVTFTLSPYLLIGIFTLSYLVYVTILDAANATVPGIVGLFTCIGCTWPIFASLVTGVGTSSIVASAVYSNASFLSTVAFVLTVWLLYWRPYERFDS